MPRLDGIGCVGRDAFPLNASTPVGGLLQHGGRGPLGQSRALLFCLLRSSGQLLLAIIRGEGMLRGLQQQLATSRTCRWSASSPGLLSLVLFNTLEAQLVYLRYALDRLVNGCKHA